MNYIKMGRRIRCERRLAGFTQEKLAEKAGVSASFLGHIERGSRKASLETLVNIANALQIGSDPLLRGSLRHAVDVGDYFRPGIDMPDDLRRMLNMFIAAYHEYEKRTT